MADTLCCISEKNCPALSRKVTKRSTRYVHMIEQFNKTAILFSLKLMANLTILRARLSGKVLEKQGNKLFTKFCKVIVCVTA